MRLRSASHAPGSPCVRKMRFGALAQRREPVEQLDVVGVRRQGVEVVDLRAHRHVAAVDLHLRRAVRPSPRRACRRPGSRRRGSRCAESGAKRLRWCSTRPPVAMPLPTMITIGHAGSSSRRRFLGEVRRSARRCAHRAALRRVQPMLVAVLEVDAGRVGGHRAVQVDRQAGGDRAGCLQARAGSRGSSGRARRRRPAPPPRRRGPRCARRCAASLAARIGAIVPPVAVGGFEHHHVRALHRGRARA